MNIFALSRNPHDASIQMIDKHIIKMPTESCQMLHTNALYFDYIEHFGLEPTLKQLKQFHKDIGSNLMKPAMLNHPSTIWARETIHNYRWLFEHAKALCSEYTIRYGKIHGSEVRILDVAYVVHDDSNWQLATPVTIAMDDKYRLPIESRQTFANKWEFVIMSYRNYYLEGKWRIASWTKRDRPLWWPINHIALKWNYIFTEMNKSGNFAMPLKLLPLEEE